MVGTQSARRGRKGFTLVEMVLSLGIISILLVSMGGLIVVAAKSLPSRKKATDGTSSAGSALERISGELSQAISITEAKDKSIEFTVADRDASGSPETIRYQWSGVKDAPLERRYNGGLPTILADQLTSFGLTYSVESTKIVRASSGLAVPEAQVAGWNSILTLFSASADTGKPVGQNFMPTLPANTRSWTVTRVRFLCSRAGAGTRDTSVQLRTTDVTGKPTNVILASTILPNTALAAAMTMTEVVFTSAPALAPDQEISIVFECSTGCPSIQLGYATLSLAASQAMWIHNGTQWNGNTLNSIPFAVFATAVQSVPTELQSAHLSSVTASLVAGSGQAMRTSVRLCNEPEVTP